MQVGIINSSWLNLHPTQRADPRYWLAILEWLDRNNLPHNQENIPKAIVGLQEHTVAELARAQELRTAGSKLHADAREIEDAITVPPTLSDRQMERMREKARPNPNTPMQGGAELSM